LSTKKQGSGVREGTVPDLRTECNEVVESGLSPAKLIFITGGARSGKSAFALNLANSMGKRKCYLATAQALDSEMEERIARHKAERGNDWDCIEESLKVAEKIEELKGRYDVILLDCLTLWVSNLMHKSQRSVVRGQEVEEIGQLVAVCKKSRTTVIVVSNEVGLGIVPDNQLAREFRDIAGMANQLFAKAADEAYFVVSGIPMRLK